ncbi:MAG: helix-turn-helix transcriptional regulator [Clostridiales bacterium]|nr:helix-turn-helix transcriptional regulator [Clostridiales bacterium]
MQERIKALRKALNVSQKEFAEQLGLTQTFLSMIERGKNPLSEKTIKLICSTFPVSEAWLRYGDGEMFNSSLYEKEFSELFATLRPASQEYILLMARELLKTQQKLLESTEETPDHLPEEPAAE